MSRQISTHLNSCASMMQASVVHSEAFFKIKLHFFVDTFILKVLIQIIKIDIFCGDLTDISAKK